MFFIFKLSGEMPESNGIRGSVQGMNAEYFLSDDCRQALLPASLRLSVLERADVTAVLCALSHGWLSPAH